MSSSMITHPEEIQDRLRKRYLDRLAQRLRKLRRDLVDRNWVSLKSECHQLSSGGEQFGYEDLVRLAAGADRTIPEGEISRARNLPEAKAAVEALIAEIETVLVLGEAGR